MSGLVVPLFRALRRTRDWSTQELAEFYRVESALIQAGIRIETERGLSDEGDPWFAFCRSDDGEVIVHIARVDNSYVLAGSAYDGIARGFDIHSLIRDLVSRHPLVQSAGGPRNSSNILLHPTALLVAVVATAFFKTSEAQALSEPGSGEPGAERTTVAGGVRLTSSPDGGGSVTMDAFHTAVIVSAILTVLDPTLRFALEQANDLFASEPASSADAQKSWDAPAERAVAALNPDHAAHSQTADASAADDVDAQEVAAVDQPVQPHAKAVPAESTAALSLLAVLWDLPKVSTPGPTLDKAPAGVDGLAAFAEPMMPVQHDRALLTVELARGSNELPNIEAAKLLKAEGVFATLDLHNISHVAQLPTALLNTIDNGLHAQVSFTPVNLQAIETMVAAPSLLVGVHEPLAPVEGPQTLVSVAMQQGHQDLLIPYGNDDVLAALQHFIDTTPKLNIVATDHSIVICDVNALNAHFVDVRSFTWDFSDGSTLSLVGLVGSLPAHLASIANVA